MSARAKKSEVAHQEFKFKGFTIIDNKIFYTVLSAFEKLVIVILLRFQGRNDKSFPSHRKIGELASLSVRTVRRTLDSLVEKGVLIVYSRAHEGRSNFYKVVGFDTFNKDEKKIYPDINMDYDPYLSSNDEVVGNEDVGQTDSGFGVGVGHADRAYKSNIPYKNNNNKPGIRILNCNHEFEINNDLKNVVVVSEEEEEVATQDKIEKKDSQPVNERTEKEATNDKATTEDPVKALNLGFKCPISLKNLLYFMKHYTVEKIREAILIIEHEYEGKKDKIRDYVALLKHLLEKGYLIPSGFKTPEELEQERLEREKRKQQKIAEIEKKKQQEELQLKKAKQDEEIERTFDEDISEEERDFYLQNARETVISRMGEFLTTEVGVRIQAIMDFTDYLIEQGLIENLEKNTNPCEN